MIAGTLAGRLVWRQQSLNWLRSAIIGVLGAIIGGFLFTALNIRLPKEIEDVKFSLADVIVAFAGAVIFLFIVKFLTQQQQPQK